MELDKACRLCLSEPTSQNETAPEDDDLRRKMDKIFYFEIVRNIKAPTWICISCISTIDSFYVYAESVLMNQEALETKDFSIVSKLCSASDIKIEPEPKESAELKGEEIDVDDEAIDTKEGICEPHDDDDYREVVPSEESDDSEDIDEDSTDEESTEEVPSPKRKKIAKKSPPAKPDKRKNANEEKVLKEFSLACDLCSKPMESFRELNKHFKELHSQEPYIVCCEKKLYRTWVMIEHLMLHVDPHSFRCHICNKDYSSSRVLKEHTKELHAPSAARSFKCDQCDKAFVQRSHLNAHRQVSHGSFPCPQCPSTLMSKKSLTKHIQMMHGEGDRYVCDICARVFRYKQGFDKHRKNHLGTRAEEKVQCTECASWFTDQNCLRKHIKRAHVVSEVPLACELCGWPAQNQPNLYRHMKQAHAESKHECEFCGKKFKRQHHMKEHVAIHHTGAALYTCAHCSEPFNSKNKLYTHRKSAHPAEYDEELRKRHMKDTW